MKYIKLFENFNNDILEDAKWIVISHLGEVKEVEVPAKNLLMFELLEEPSEEQINKCREHLKEEGFFLSDPGLIDFYDHEKHFIVGIGNSVKEYCINWLNDNFSGLEAVPSKSFPNTVLYRHDLKDNVLLYDKTNNKVYINYQKIWAFLEHYFDLDENDIQEITEQWISETYNLNATTTRFGVYYGRFEKCE
jgi:hypothetical protein